MPDKMSTYIGTKMIAAKPMTREEYNAYRGWQVPSNENPTDTGYLVEYLDGHLGNDSRHAGYISWSPTVAFEAAYNSIHAGMSFGHALVALQKENRVCRAGWNGKNMYLILIDGSTGDGDVDYIIRDDSPYQPIGQSPKLLPFIAMRTVSGEFVPWLASQTDVLAQDWMVVSHESEPVNDIGYDAELREVLITTPIDPLNQDIYLTGEIYGDRDGRPDGELVTTAKLESYDSVTQVATTVAGDKRFKISLAEPKN